MAYTAEHGYLTFLGDAFTQLEEWQFGLRLNSAVTPTNAQLDSCNTAASAFLTTKMGTGYRFLGVKWAKIGVDGKYPPDASSIVRLLATPVVGSAGTVLPPQCSMVVTLQSGISRGRGSKGRIYPPPPNFMVVNDGRVSATDRDSYRTLATSFINSINSAGIGRVCVMSTLDLGITAPVTAVKVGRVIDTQRRRREGLQEDYGTTAVTP